MAAHGVDQHAQVWGVSLDNAPVGGVEGYQADLAVPGAAHELVAAVKPDLIFHLAGIVPRDGIEVSAGEFTRGNVVGTLRVLEAVQKNAPNARTLVASSAAVYGAAGSDRRAIDEETQFCPLTDYAASKAEQDQLAGQFAQDRGLAVMRARTFNQTGPGERLEQVCATLARQVAEIEAGVREPEVTVRYLSTRRDYTDVRDVVRAYWMIVEQGDAGAAYNVCSGKAWSVGELLDCLLKLAGLSGVRVVEREEQPRPGDVPVSVGDAGRLKAHTGWAPTIPLEQSLGDLLNEWRERVKSS